MRNIMTVFVVAILGAGLFNLLHLPVPWMLGPIFSLLLVQFFYKGRLSWPPMLRDLALVILGLSIGQQFNLGLFNDLGMLLIYLIILNIALIGGSIGLAYILSKWSKLPLKSMILCTLPGGLTQVITFAEEVKGVDLAAITYFHIIRLLIIVSFVPFLVAGQIAPQPEVIPSYSFSLFLIIIIAWLLAFFGQKLKIPVAYFLVPVLFAMIVSTSSIGMPEFPPSLMQFAQLSVGAHIGLILKPGMIRLPVRYLVAGFLSSAGLILVTFLTSFVLSITVGASFTTSFLSNAPGGLDQMVILAEVTEADVSMVTVFQIFRLLFLFFLVIPGLSYFYKWWETKRGVTARLEEKMN